MNHGDSTQDKHIDAMDSNKILNLNSPHSLTRKRRQKSKDHKSSQPQQTLIQIKNDNYELLDQTASNTDSIHLLNDHDSIEMMQVDQRSLTRDPMSVSQRCIHGKTKTSHAFWNLCKCYVGAASFALPWAVSQTGAILAAIGFIFLSCLAYLTFRWMLIASHYASTNANPTYPELAEIAFSSFFPVLSNTNTNNTTQNGFIPIAMEEKQADNSELTDNIDEELYNMMSNNEKYIKYNYRCGMCSKIVVYLCMFCGMIGACGSYILFISSVIQNWLSFWIDPSSSLSFYVSIAILLPFPIMLSLLRSYSFLSSTAKFGVAGVVLALLVTMYDGILHISDGVITKDVLHTNLTYFDASGFPIFVGNACFLFVIHAMILSQEQSMVDRERHSVSNQFNKANHLSLLLVTLINMIFAIFAYISFIDMDPFPDNIVDGLDAGIIQQITRACLCIDLLFTYALIMYPFTEALDSEIFDVTQLTNNTNVMMKGNITRIAIVIITALIAIGIPHFGYLTGLTGGSASIFLGFILPPIFIWRLAPHKVHKLELYILCPIIFIFGCVMFIWSPYLILSKMYS